MNHLPQRCLIIAEVGVNHDGSLARAISLVWAAHDAGADAVKFQAFSTDRLTSSRAPTADYQRRRTACTDQRKMLRSLEFSRDDFRVLKTEADVLGMEFMASPFDPEEVEMLVELGVRRIKIASPELTDVPLLRAAARTGLPLIVSTGAATEAEIEQALEVIRAAGDPPVTLLACVTRYPTPFSKANIRRMVTLRERFGLPVGYSDHTEGVEAAPLAVAAGAVVLEKHFTLDRRLPGPDHAASVEPAELARLVEAVRRTEEALGDGRLEPDEAERRVAQTARKSIVAAVSIPRGTRLRRPMLAIKRPGTGLPPAAIRKVVGSYATTDIEPDTPITEEMLCACWSSPPTRTTRRSA